MLALCRIRGLAARYVSGHLVGQGGTHAWVEVVVPSADGHAAEAVGYDPCNGRRTGAGHVTVATGRDYRDVPPTVGQLRRHRDRQPDHHPRPRRPRRRLTAVRVTPPDAC